MSEIPVNDFRFNPRVI